MRASLLLLAAASLVLAGAVGAQDDTTNSKVGKMSVVGSSTVQATPDVGKVTLTIQKTEPTVAEACDVVSQTAATVTAAVKEIETAEVSTVGLSVSQNTTYMGDAGERFNGYICSNSVSVKITDDNSTALAAALGQAVDLAVENGGNLLTVGQMTTELSPQLRASATNSAREAAVDDAKATADTLAKAAGVKLGPIRSIVDTNVAPTPVPMPMEAAAAPNAAGARAPTPVSIGTTDVTATVNMEFAFDN